ncbi:hypothetical protein B9Z55_021409 [Caenorhabditis nigoni]|nr:hypothetical protein B9Z55_021409 [Caenorhabditis nigoni]
MELILRDLQYIDIDSLRNVNQGIRMCIDLIKPNPHIETYSIRIRQHCKNGTYYYGSEPLLVYIDLCIFVGSENGEWKEFNYSNKEVT